MKFQRPRRARSPLSIFQMVYSHIFKNGKIPLPCVQKITFCCCCCCCFKSAGVSSRRCERLWAWSTRVRPRALGSWPSRPCSRSCPSGCRWPASTPPLGSLTPCGPSWPTPLKTFFSPKGTVKMWFAHVLSGLDIWETFQKCVDWHSSQLRIPSGQSGFLLHYFGVKWN